MKKFICILILMFSLSHCTSNDAANVVITTSLLLIKDKVEKDNKDDN